MLRLKKKSRGRNKIFSSKHLKISIKAVTVLLSVKKILFLWKNRWDIRFFRAYLESRSRGLRDNVDRLWERLTRGSWWFNETRFTRFQANADAILINHSSTRDSTKVYWGITRECVGRERGILISLLAALSFIRFEMELVRSIALNISCWLNRIERKIFYLYQIRV